MRGRGKKTAWTPPAFKPCWGVTRRDEVILTRQDLEDGGEEEAAALDQPEQLVEEGDKGEKAEEDGEDHESLDCLDPVWRSRETGGGGQL